MIEYLPLRFPKIGDKVEFFSDLQAEKGPSSGSVTAADWQSGLVEIRHSDHPGEMFDWAKVKVSEFGTALDGRPLWQLV